MWLGERRHPGIQTSNSFFSLASFLAFQKSCRTFWVPTFWLCWQSVDLGLVYQTQLFLSRAHGEFNDAWGIQWFSVCAFFWLLKFFFRTRHSAFGALDHIIWADLKKISSDLATSKLLSQILYFDGSASQKLNLAVLYLFQVLESKRKLIRIPKENQNAYTNFTAPKT